MDIDKQAYEDYFRQVPVDPSTIKAEKPDGESPYTYNQFDTKNIDLPVTTEDISVTNNNRFIAENNMSDVDQLGELLRLILNAAWGDDWGTISPEFSEGENNNSPKFPQITYDTNSRESADKMGIKPMLFDTIKEVVNGNPTGDMFNVYRQWFDNVIEFNFWGRTNKEARQIMSDFENIMGAYAGHLKKQGLSEAFFLKEVPSKTSTKYIPGINMRSIMYYVRFERIQTIRHSTINKIDVAINTDTEITKTQLSTGH